MKKRKIPECPETTTGEHLFKDTSQIGYKTNKTRKAGSFWTNWSGSNEVMNVNRTRTVLPQCFFCGMVDTRVKPEIVHEHEEYNTDDLLFD